MADKPVPAFPCFIQVCRGTNQPPTWEIIEPNNRVQRIQQLEIDPVVIWFYAYEIKTYRIVAVKKTIVVTETPTGADAEGEV